MTGKRGATEKQVRRMNLECVQSQNRWRTAVIVLHLGLMVITLVPISIFVPYLGKTI